MSLAKQLNDFCFELLQNRGSLKSTIKTIEDEEFFRRVLFNRLYYSLFHKYLELDNELRSSSVKQHEAIKEKLKYSKNIKFYLQFVKLQNLRIWADYRYDDYEKAKSINLNKLLRDVHKLIEMRKI